MYMYIYTSEIKEAQSSQLPVEYNDCISAEE